MMDIILTLVFASALLVVMVYPAMRIADVISNKFTLNQAVDDKLTIILTIILSLSTGALLKFV